MNINGINAYTLSALYGQDSSDPLLETSDTKKQSDLYSILGTSSSSSLSDSVDFSQTADFFSKLKQLEQSDPDKFKELAQKLGQRLQSAGGFAGQVLAGLAQQVADGTDISEVITQSSTSTAGLYTSTGTSTDQAKQLLLKILSNLSSYDES
jgi:hypothetical protein